MTTFIRVKCILTIALLLILRPCSTGHILAGAVFLSALAVVLIVMKSE